MWKNLILALALTVSSGAFAADTDVVFTALDTDHNGSVSQTEANVNAFVTASFAAADTNKDASLSKEEFSVAFAD